MANNYNNDIRHSVYTLPIIDNYGIAGELSVEELNRYQLNPGNGKVTPRVWYETIIRIPHWTKHTRYCNYCSELPFFENLKASGSSLKTEITDNRSSSSIKDRITLKVTSDYSYKEFTTSKNSFPSLPDQQTSALKKRIITILMGVNPIMLREFDTDSYQRWSWVDDVMGSWFENQPMKAMPHSNPKVLKFNPGDHYRIAIIMGDDNKPEAIILDDAQGAFRRKLYTYLSPLHYAANLFELPHHAREAYDFGAASLSEKGIHRVTNAIFSARNAFEFSEHVGHLQVVQKSWKHFSRKDANNTEVGQEGIDEFEPDYILGSLDAGNLVLASGELIYKYGKKGFSSTIPNMFSLGIILTNLIVSMNQQSLVEGYHDRIDKLIQRYFVQSQRQLYLKYREML